MLSVCDLRVSYGAAPAVIGASLVVSDGELVALVGSNGAGKTTLLRAISGLLRVDGGTVELAGTALVGLPPHRIVLAGVAHVPQGRYLFAGMSIQDNLEVGLARRTDRKTAASRFGTVYELFPVLHERRQQKAGTLSGGQQQMLAIGRALMSNPAILLLDEPSTGLAPAVVDDLVERIRSLCETGLGVLLVEQNAAVALDVASRAYVMSHGRVSEGGPAEDLRESDIVRRAYLGELDDSDVSARTP